MSVSFAELMLTIDVNNIDPESYHSTLLDEYEHVTAENYYTIVTEANRRYEFIAANEKLHGFYIVNWRINFSTVCNYIELHVPADKRDKTILAFLYYHNDESADELYKRLGLDEEEDEDESS